ncbi:hypothetical protein QTP70_006092 [Hemibagrus guttatus]|uniref:Uncharacterized protein n=1 Tax=Hemibagrus guttatus TaxID=175788 RepID=A0AAE0Q223_9TELE|nr:hypothetical protein QTP70_006092 [Hemibagrus guttatus]KAK3536334.1 hypothetical protein QTP86_006016 [Hemibagrus guttatus]
MSSQLTQCRQGLAKALGQAMKPLPEVSYCSATTSGPGPILYVSCPLSSHHPELLHNLSLTQTAHNPILTWHRANHGQESRHDLEAFTISIPEPEQQDLPVHIESPSMETLDELMAKLEFENELNRVCNRFSLNVNTPPARRDSTGSADSGVDEGEENEEDVRLMDTVLDMEQDYELLVY